MHCTGCYSTYSTQYTILGILLYLARWTITITITIMIMIMIMMIVLITSVALFYRTKPFLSESYRMSACWHGVARNKTRYDKMYPWYDEGQGHCVGSWQTVYHNSVYCVFSESENMSSSLSSRSAESLKCLDFLRVNLMRKQSFISFDSWIFAAKIGYCRLVVA
jgi:hypothetical protein